MRWKITFLSLMVLGLIVLARSFVIVDQSETVYITEFGRPIRQIDEPGLIWKLPWQSSRAFDRRLQLDAPPPREMLTRDKKNLEVAWYVSWKVAEVERFLRSVRTLPDASARLEDMAASVIAAELVGHDLPDLVKIDEESAIDIMMNQVTSRVAEQAGKEFGLAVVDVRLRRLNYPEEIRESVFEQIRSERRRVAAATRAEGESQARTIRSAADLERSKAVAEAEAEAARITGEGEAQAARIANEAHAVNPGFYKFLKSLDTYRTALDQKTTLILSADSPFLKLLTQGIPDAMPASSTRASVTPAAPRSPVNTPATPRPEQTKGARP
jgi:membrane protease subunit HflC